MKWIHMIAREYRRKKLRYVKLIGTIKIPVRCVAIEIPVLLQIHHQPITIVHNP